MADEDMLEEGNGDEIIRAKWIMDGATNLPQAAQLVREFADHLDILAAQGYQLREEINDDYGFIYKPE